MERNYVTVTLCILIHFVIIIVKPVHMRYGVSAKNSLIPMFHEKSGNRLMAIILININRYSKKFHWKIL